MKRNFDINIIGDFCNINNEPLKNKDLSLKQWNSIYDKLLNEYMNGDFSAKVLFTLAPVICEDFKISPNSGFYSKNTINI